MTSVDPMVGCVGKLIISVGVVLIMGKAVVGDKVPTMGGSFHMASTTWLRSCLCRNGTRVRSSSPDRTANMVDTGEPRSEMH